ITDLEKEVKELKNVDHSLALLAKIRSEVPTAVKEYIGTNLNDALHKLLQRHTAEVIQEHSVLADVIDVPKQQQKPQISAEEIQKIKMEQVEKQPESKYTIRSSDKTALPEFELKQALFDSMHASKSFNKNPTNKTLYHALMEYFIEDENCKTPYLRSWLISGILFSCNFSIDVASSHGDS
nr:hypothetical protein [Tanacetum cinerariifolium]